MWRMEQYLLVGEPSKFCAKIQSKPKENKWRARRNSMFTFFDDYEVKTNDILSEHDDFFCLTVQLAVTCEGIEIASATTDFFQASSFQLLKLEIHCEDHISPSYISAVHI